MTALCKIPGGHSRVSEALTTLRLNMGESVNWAERFVDCFLSFVFVFFPGRRADGLYFLYCGRYDWNCWAVSSILQRLESNRWLAAIIIKTRTSPTASTASTDRQKRPIISIRLFVSWSRRWLFSILLFDRHRIWGIKSSSNGRSKKPLSTFTHFLRFVFEFDPLEIELNDSTCDGPS